ncbi:neutral zinc metallopeptidase [Micromonosporaceae bacterium Da 78-11]
MMRRVLVLVTLLVVAGCGFVDLPEVSTGPGPVQDAESSGVVTKSLRDVERFWTTTYPELAGGAKFEPVRGGYHPYTEADPPPSCGGQQGVYQPNAFYCPDGDFIAWDAQTLIPQLQDEFGPLLVGVVMAHEYGHAIQTRLGRTDSQPTVVLEQQADCFAGAWTADVLAGRSDAVTGVTPAQLDDTVAGLLLLRDQPGTSAQTEGAHGNAFDRIRALQDGVQQGARACAKYDADTLPVTEVPFSTRQEAASGGELPYPDAVNLLATDAQDYWARTFPDLTGKAWPDLRVQAFDPASPPSCAAPDPATQGAAFYCADSDFIAFDNRQLGPELYQRFGDNAVGMLLGDLFARAAQDRRGASTSDRAGQLAVDCLAGSWTNDLLRRDPSTTRIRLSPGDLDEAVAALLAFGRATDGSGPTAFDRIAAYRKGVIEGLTACG